MQHCEQKQEEMDKSLQCSICLTDYKKPKQLPCLHTFCLGCLETLCDPVADDQIPCPLCRREFSVPEGGLERLSDDLFMTRLILQKELVEGGQRSTKQNLCEPCMEIGEEIPADSFCMECRQSLCRRCTMLHTKVTSSRLHKIVSIEEKPAEEDLQRLMSSYCAKHSNKEIELYCCDCRMLICVLCHATSHYKHVCKESLEIAKQIKRLVEKDRESIEESLSGASERSQKWVNANQSFMFKVSETESDVRNSFSKVHQLLVISEAKMLEELAIFKEKSHKEMESKRELEEFRNTALASFLTYSRMVVERGTDCEIIRGAEDLHKRAEELINENKNVNSGGITEQQLSFITPPTPSQEDIQKLVGKIAYKTSDASRWITGVRSTVELAKHNDCIRGIEALGNDMFVVIENQPEVWVYDLPTMKAVGNVNIPMMKAPECLAVCTYNKALYISDPGVKSVHRIDLTNNSVTRWKMRENHDPHSLSVTAEHTVLVTVGIGPSKGPPWIAGQSESGVVEYTSEGQQVHEIRFDRSIKWAWQTVKLSSDQFIVCHGWSGSSLHRVCVINAEGHIIKSFGREGGRGEDQLNVPCSLPIDDTGKLVFVADRENSRVVMFDTDLTYLGQIKTSRDLSCPNRLYFDSATNRLFVGELSGRLFYISPD